MRNSMFKDVWKEGSLIMMQGPSLPDILKKNANHTPNHTQLV